MFKTKLATNRNVLSGLAFAGGVGFPLSTLAQAVQGSCAISLGYAPLAVASTATPVPSVTTLGVVALSAVVACVGLIKFKSTRCKALMTAGLIATASFGIHQGDGLIREARAAVAYVFDSPTGGTVADAALPYADPAALQTLTNTSGVAVRIVSNANSADTGTCQVGSTIPAGGSCTTLPACTPPPTPVLLQMDVVTPPSVVCDGNQVILAAWGPPPPKRGTNSELAGEGMLMAQPPTFSPAAPSPVVTFTPPPPYLSLLFDGAGQPTNLAEARAPRTATVTAVAPSGYGFGPNLESTLTWQTALDCTYRSFGMVYPDEPG
ncbi:midcut-by-XrtH protein [Comamonas sp. 4034]|uniref:midcut-by-XrtH protein n=1 Tax=Comamonas sp. 4034 TaxID=3156455 RepID=UPI003D19BA47